MLESNTVKCASRIYAFAMRFVLAVVAPLYIHGIAGRVYRFFFATPVSLGNGAMAVCFIHSFFSTVGLKAVKSSNE